MNCDFCGGTLNYLGRLGSVDWMRCEDCGMDSMHHSRGDAPNDLRDSESVDGDESGE